MSATTDRILELLETKGTASTVEICNALGDATSNARGNLRRLEADGKIDRVGYGPARNLAGDPVGGPPTAIWALPQK